ncbi:MAG: FAD-dependent oxidoreductase [Candidatus Niyogibacteria bacterium]|nr:FAD-dependent oxidoreductase [Candidatus Niyogibacteria bacterium]
MPKRYCIIGGGVAGTTAAETIRARDPEGEVLLVSAESHPLYSRVALPAYVMGELGRENVMMRTLRDYAARGIRFLSSERAVTADPENHRIGLASGAALDYDALLVASGGRLREWRTGAQADGRMFRLQTLDDAERLREFFKNYPAGGSADRTRRAVVIGGGLIALELAEIFRAKKFDVTFFVRGARFWDGKWIDPEDHGRLVAIWGKNGIEAIFGDTVAECVARGDGVMIRTKNGREIAADCVAAGIGIERNTDFLSGISGSPASGIFSEGIIVNEHLKTAMPDVWAAGDVAQCVENGVRRGSANWSTAVLQGRIAGANMTGGEEALRVGTRYSIGHFGAVLKLEDDRARIEPPKGSPLGG